MGQSTYIRIFGLLLTVCSVCLAAPRDKTNEHIFQDNVAEESVVDDGIYAGSYILPKQIFNEGKPFYLEKDPVSGALDFNSKKAASHETPNLDPLDPKTDKDISLSTNNIRLTPNIHDFLNLPVKYSSSKFVYPLVSSSYANLKYQGNNKNYVSNHKNYTPPATASTNHFTSDQKKYELVFNAKTTKVPEITKLHPTTRLATRVRPSIATTTHRHVKLTTTVAPKIISTSTTITTTTTTTTTEIPTTKAGKPIATVTTKAPSKYKYTTIKKRPLYSSTIHSESLNTTAATKPTSEIPSTVSSTYPPTPVPSTTVAFNPYEQISTQLQKNFSTPVQSTVQTTVDTTGFKKLPERVNFTFPTSALPITTTTMGPADIYQKVGEKNNKKTMTLMDLFNSFADEEPLDTTKKNMIASQPSSASTLPPAYSTNAVIPTTYATKFHYEKTAIPFHQQPTAPIPASSTYRPFTSSVATPMHSNLNDYVQYGFSAPNPNQFNYKPIPSMNNIVISPNQNSATFVLGSQQSFGNSASGGKYVGSAYQEPISVALTGNPDLHKPVITNNNGNDLQTVTPQGFKFHPSPASNKLESDEKIVNNKVRFPLDDYENAPIVTGTHSKDIAPPNGHSAPVGLPQSQVVVFPANDLNAQVSTSIGVSMTASEFDDKQNNDPVDQIQSFNEEVLKLNSRPDQQNIYTPQRDSPQISVEQKLPSFEQHNNFGKVRPPFNRPLPHYKYHDTQGKPQRPPNYPRPNGNQAGLPNILPQFRPNAKISHGHRDAPPNYGPQQYPESLRPHTNPNVRPPLPSTIFRRLPIPPGQLNKFSKPQSSIPQFHHMMPQPNNNRRIYRVPIGQEQFNGYNKENIGYTNYPRNPQSDMTAEGTEQLPYVEEIDGNRSQPKRGITESVSIERRQKLEPVITLQMIQSQKMTKKEPFPAPSVVQSFSPNTGRPISSQSEKSPVYVVYPMNPPQQENPLTHFNPDNEQVVIGKRGDEDMGIEHTSTGGEYQNTPFTLIHHEQEPILMDKKQKQKVLKFPYALERVSEQQFNSYASKYNTGESYARVVNKGPMSANSYDKISNTLTRVTEAPIAVAYTPTEPNHKYQQYHHDPLDQFSMPNVATAVIPEIRDEAAIVNSEPIHRFEQDFQAPFYPSVDLDNIPSHKNGWAVVTKPTVASKHNNPNLIDRSDINDDKKEDDEQVDSTTKKFNLDSFQPEFQTGFKPIYPENYVSDYRPDSPSVQPKDNSVVKENHEATKVEEAITNPPSTSTVAFETTSEKRITSPPIDETTDSVQNTTTESLKSLFDLLLGGDDEESSDRKL